MRLLDYALLALTLLLLGVGGYYGLVIAPPEAFMGEVYRVLYVHVPSAWMALVAFTVTFVASVVYLFRSSAAADAVAEASAEVGVVFTALLLASGSIWGKPTWGVWWTWDPRLTTAAIMFFAYAGYLALRHFVEDPDKRATWAATTAIIIFVDIPIVWFSVKWWNSLHQVQSSPRTMGAEMVTALRINAFAFLGAYLLFVRQRYFLARARRRQESSEPPELAPLAGPTDGAVEGKVSA